MNFHQVDRPALPEDLAAGFLFVLLKWWRPVPVCFPASVRSPVITEKVQT